MTAGQHTSRLSNATLAQAPLVALLAATLLGGVAIGAAINKPAHAINSGSAAPPATMFNATEFRAGERAPLPATFDSRAFRAGERAPLVVQPAAGPLSTEHRERVGGP